MNTISLWRLQGARYRLETVRCEQCGALHFPARMICPNLPHPNVQFNSLNRTQGNLGKHPEITSLNVLGESRTRQGRSESPVAF